MERSFALTVCRGNVRTDQSRMAIMFCIAAITVDASTRLTFFSVRIKTTTDKLMKGHGFDPIAGLKGEKHPNSKLTDAQAREIRNRARNGESTRALAYEFGVDISTVSMIKHGKTYRHV